MKIPAPTIDKHALLARFHDRLRDIYGDRLRGVVLYGSYARDDAEEDSDLDLLVLLDGPVAFGRELKQCIDALYDFTLELGIPLSPHPVDVDRYESSDEPLFASAREEGFRL